MKDAKLKKLQNDNVGKQLLNFIPNNLGINLCSVKDISINRQSDGKLKEINIIFESENKEEPKYDYNLSNCTAYAC